MPFGGSRLRRFPDAPLAHLVGTPAKRATEIGAPSLKHPFARVFPRLSPFAAGELKVVKCGPLRSATEDLGNIDHTSISRGRYQLLLASHLHRCLHIRASKLADFRCFPNAREQAGFETLISAVNKRRLVRLKILFREECGFDPHRPHHP